MIESGAEGGELRPTCSNEPPAQARRCAPANSTRRDGGGEILTTHLERSTPARRLGTRTCGRGRPVSAGASTSLFHNAGVFSFFGMGASKRLDGLPRTCSGCARQFFNWGFSASQARGCRRCARSAASPQLRRPVAVVNLSSVAGLVGLPRAEPALFNSQMTKGRSDALGSLNRQRWSFARKGLSIGFLCQPRSTPARPRPKENGRQVLRHAVAAQSRPPQRHSRRRAAQAAGAAARSAAHGNGERKDKSPRASSFFFFPSFSRLFRTMPAFLNRCGFSSRPDGGPASNPNQSPLH